ncbi:MAG: LytR C-terminal domain-containing protein, partial [bacterium]|nr:LytR C-terminal domain-containing protein [bacterium]
YNTTSVPLLAQRVARLLGHVGAVVVSVKNDLEETAACTISGEDTALDSETARFIEVHYGCSHSEEEGDDASDLTVRIGSSYASRFGVLRE